MKRRRRVGIIHSSCSYTVVRMVDKLRVCMGFVRFTVWSAPEISGVVDDVEQDRKGRETRRSQGLPQAAGQVYSSGRPSPDGQDETTWKIGNGGLDAIHLCLSSMHRCYPAHSDIHTSTRHKQIRETTTGEDERAKCNPHVDKHRKA